jgi:hypothetical protein
MSNRVQIDPNPDTEVVACISSEARKPWKMRIAKRPMASTFGITDTWGNGDKYVGFVMVGGTVEQFDDSVAAMKRKCERMGWKPGVFIHAQAGSYEHHFGSTEIVPSARNMDDEIADMADAHMQGLHDDAHREFCPECEPLR